MNRISIAIAEAMAIQILDLKGQIKALEDTSAELEAMQLNIKSEDTCSEQAKAVLRAFDEMVDNVIDDMCYGIKTPPPATESEADHWRDVAEDYIAKYEKAVLEIKELGQFNTDNLRLREENSQLKIKLRETKRERDNWIETAAQNQRNANYYRDIVIAIGELFGKEAKTSDDGTLQRDVLCAKVYDLVEQLNTKLEDTKSVMNAFDEVVDNAVDEACYGIKTQEFKVGDCVLFDGQSYGVIDKLYGKIARIRTDVDYLWDRHVDHIKLIS